MEGVDERMEKGFEPFVGTLGEEGGVAQGEEGEEAEGLSHCVDLQGISL
jgi:hypothetical protein